MARNSNDYSCKELSLNRRKSAAKANLEDYLMEMKSISKNPNGNSLDIDDETLKFDRSKISSRQPIINTSKKVIAPGVTQYTTKVTRENFCRKKTEESSEIIDKNNGTLISVKRIDIVKTCPGCSVRSDENQSHLPELE